jgi:hypothetical protein
MQICFEIRRIAESYGRRRQQVLIPDTAPSATTSIKYIASGYSLRNAPPVRRYLVVTLSPLRPGFDPRPGCVGFVVVTVAQDTGFSMSTSVFPCNYHFVIALYSYFSHLPPTLYNVRNCHSRAMKHLRPFPSFLHAVMFVN